MDWPKATARQDDNHLSFWVGAAYIGDFFMVVTFIQGNALKVTFNTMSHVYNELTHLLRYLRFFVLEEVFTMIYQFNFVEVFFERSIWKW